MDFWRTNSGDMQVGHLRQRYLWGPAVDQILAEEAVDGGADETVQWTLTDHLNTVRDIAKYDPGSDMTTVVNHLIYDAFGRVTSESSPAVDSLFLFTGRPFDSWTSGPDKWVPPSDVSKGHACRARCPPGYGASPSWQGPFTNCPYR